MFLLRAHNNITYTRTHHDGLHGVFPAKKARADGHNNNIQHRVAYTLYPRIYIFLYLCERANIIILYVMIELMVGIRCFLRALRKGPIYIIEINTRRSLIYL